MGLVTQMEYGVMRIGIPVALVLMLGASAIAGESTEESTSESGDAVTSVVDSARMYVPAKPIERTAPHYPQTALSRGREAWIHVAYCIDEAGTPQNISVLDATGNKSFEKAAISSIKRWRFEPALVNGEPSWQSRNQSYIIFAIAADRRGASRRFISRYKTLRKLIEEGRLDEADVSFNRILANDTLNLYELGRLWELRVRYELETGDLLKLDLALRRASASNGEWIEPETYQQLLALRTRIQAQMGHYPAFRSSYEELVDAAGEQSPLVQDLVPLTNKVSETVNSGSILQIQGEVREKGGCHGCDDSYAFTPEHRTLSFRNIDGALDSIEMRCDHRHFESEISDLVEWKIPEEWGRCRIQVRGEPGTTFSILMIPDA